MPKSFKTAGGPTLPMRRIAARFKGLVVAHHHPFGDHVQTWPRKRGQSGTPAQLQARADFAAMVDAVKNTLNADKVGGMMIASGSSYTWRDVVSRQVTGTLIDIEFNGTEATILKTFLETLGTTPGLIIICGADGGWVALAPGDEGQVLEMFEGLPAWKNPSGGGLSNGSISYEFLSTDQTVNPTPTSNAAISGLSITLPAAAADRTVLVNAMLVTQANNARFSLMLDGTVFETSMHASTDNDGYSSVPFAGVPILIPGDNATHQIDVGLEASGSTSATVLKGTSNRRCSLTIIDPGVAP